MVATHSLSFDAWLDCSATGQYVRDWQQRHYDEVVDKIFGYHALHIGVATIEALRTSRIQGAWRVGVETPETWPADARSVSTQTHEHTQPGSSRQPSPPALYAAPEALPFGADQFDLIVMPHGLEACHQPHAALREATRVLRPEGQLIVSGFNPARFWLASRPSRSQTQLGKPIGYLRLRDWLHLLNFEVEQVWFGCHIPPFTKQQWYERLAWIDRLAEDRLPLCGSTYFLTATKKVQGVRMLEAGWKPLRAKATRAAAVNRAP
ncbi:hypothetical protein AAV94_07570 [Lampropedia cohaerens]|uniref:Methyltransferase type 11 domain-containing protein n=1 Tax=Lampropedia cohaerens TaxID=1610491 RepID=A0A0U1PZS6_9BURK|nr:class I SAM-dependent methyltransferase [Lampropedia cohaerens]KKW68013.1 hypothetical protein AAV94_07570 [Lampropedia cohaerens]